MSSSSLRIMSSSSTTRTRLDAEAPCPGTLLMLAIPPQEWGENAAAAGCPALCWHSRSCCCSGSRERGGTLSTWWDCHASSGLLSDADPHSSGRKGAGVPKQPAGDGGVGRMQFLLDLRRRGITDVAVLRALDE